MATVINNPPSEGSGAGTIIGLVLAVIIIALLFIYGLPMVRGTNDTAAPGANVNINLPTGSSGNNEGQ